MPLPYPTKYDDRIDKLQGKLKRRERLGGVKGGGKPKTSNKQLKFKLVKNQTKAWQSNQKQRAANFKPWTDDPVYQDQVGGYFNTWAQGHADIAGRQEANRLQYGWDESGSAYGANPFSVAAQLEHDYRTRQNKTLGSYARSGQLYAGSLSNARNIDSRNALMAQDKSMREFLAAQGEQTTAGRELDTKYGTYGPDGKLISEGTDVLAAREKAIDRYNQSPAPTAEAPPSYVRRYRALKDKMGPKKPKNKKGKNK